MVQITFEYLLNFFILIVIARAFYLPIKGKPLAIYFFPAFFTKSILGIVWIKLYSFHYQGGDIWSFIRDANFFTEKIIIQPHRFFNIILLDSVEQSQLFTSFGVFETTFFIKIISILNFITFHHIELISLYFSLFSTICLLFFLTIFVEKNPEMRLGLMFSFLIFPEANLWSSGFGKETLAFGFLLLTGGILLDFKNSLCRYALLLLSIYGIFVTKFYFLSALFLFFIPISLPLRFKKNKYFPAFLATFYLVVFALVEVFCRIFLKVNLLEFIKINHQIYRTLNFSDVLFFKEINNFIDIVINAAFGIFYTLIAPNFMGGFSWLRFIYGLLITPLPFLAVFSIIFQFRNKLEWEPVIWICLFFGVAMSIIIPFATPSIAPFVRYRSFYSPFIVLACFRIVQKAVKEA